MKKQIYAFACLSLLTLTSAHAADVKVLDGLAADVLKRMKGEPAPVAAADTPPEKPRANKKEANTPKKAPESGPDAMIAKLEFKQAKIVDVIRALADMSGLNIVATNEAANKDVTLFLQNITVKDAIDTIVKNSGLWYREEKAGKTIRIMTTAEYQQDMVVYREDETRVFNLLHPNPVVVATAIRDLYGERVILSLGRDDPTYGKDANNIISSAGEKLTNTTNTTNAAGQGGAAARNAARQAANAGIVKPSAASGTQAANNGVSAGRVAEDAIIEGLTADQIIKLENALKRSADGQVSAELLREIIRTEQLIYITVNREHNLILVRTGDGVAMKEIERLIKEMDRPTPQVLLEMKILELSVGDTFRQAFDIETESLSANQFHTFTGGGGDLAEASSFIYTFLNNSISAKLELLQKNNEVNTLSSPILMASNNRPARVFVGDEWVLVKGITVTDPTFEGTGAARVQITPARVTYQLEDRDIGNTLTILPKINADRTVTLVIQADNSTVNIGGITLPPYSVGDDLVNFKIDAVKTSTIEATVIAKDGLTVAIGGLITTNFTDDVRKIPLLSDIPLVGDIFRKVDRVASKKELVLLITPHIITNPMEGVKATENQMDNLPLEVENW